MKILKKNQLIILVISMMLITAGYLNFTNNEENIKEYTISDRDNKNIGNAQLVSTVPSNNELNVMQDIKEEPKIKEEINVNNANLENKSENSDKKDKKVDTKKIEENDDFYFVNSKLERNTMYSEQLATYQEIYNNDNSNSEEKKEALLKINDINNIKNEILIAENLITAKGFKDVVIFVNDESISVIIKAKELKQEQVAQIQNIISRELKVKAEKIHISNK